jgi:hypothetical protein
LKQSFDTSHNFVVFEQFAAAGGGAALFDGLDKPGVVFKHAIDGLRNELRGLSAGARCDVLEPGLLFR